MKLSSEIVSGRDGHYFLIGSVHDIYGHLVENKSIPESSLVNFYRNIETRSAYCRNRSISYKHVIFPDKLSVMKSFSPYEAINSFTSRYRPYFNDDVVDLGVGMKDEDRFFLKTDTHLNFEGRVETTLDIFENFFSIDRAMVRDALFKFKGEEVEFIGDLGSKIEPMIKEVDVVTKTSFLKRFHNQVGGNDGFAVICLNKDMLKKSNVKRLLIFGDSFCERSLQLISYMYSEILFCRSRYFHEEIVDMFQPDHVMTESAERYFSNVRLDELAPRFNLVYGLKGYDFSKNKDFYEAMNAVLNYQKPQYRIFINRFVSGFYG